MKLSEFTLEVLKNFSTINSGVVLKSGNVQRTISPEKTVLAEAEVTENVPNDFGIYDLNQFLGNVTTLDNPELEFNGKTIVMADELFSLTYRSCEPSLVNTPPDKKLELGKSDVTLDISNSSMSKLLKLAAMNGLPNLSIIGKDGNLSVMVHERANDASNSVVTQIEKYSGEDFMATFKVENLKMLPDDYSVEVKLGAFSKWTSKTRKLHYFIALEIK
jgi:hypothetical protein